MVLMLDTGLADIQDSLDQAEARFRSVDCDVHRVRLSDLGGDGVSRGGFVGDDVPCDLEHSACIGA